MPKVKAYFTPEIFEFLEDLKFHNNREWFLDNKGRYETTVRDPFLQFIADLSPGLGKINPHILVDPTPNRGSMLRIYRDTRFSEDKTPYRTFLGARFLHHKGKDSAIPTFYLHVGLSEVFAGAGIWHPDTKALKQIRDAIAAQPAKWKKIAAAIEKDPQMSWAGDSLTRPPRGFPADHPMMEYLKRKDFAVRLAFAPRDVYRPNFLELLLGRYRTAAPLVAFLSNAVGLE